LAAQIDGSACDARRFDPRQNDAVHDDLPTRTAGDL
jgi:hypothetical protein